MDKLSKAKTRLLLKHVFWSALILSTPARYTTAEESAWMRAINNGHATAFTDMTQIVYDRDFIDSLDIDTVEFVMIHEAAHIMLMHGTRLQSRDADRWNRAADYAINLMLKKAGFRLWSKCLVDDKYDGMSAEQIYDLLTDEDHKGGGGKGGPPRDGLHGDVRAPAVATREEVQRIEREIKQKVAQATMQAKLAGKLPGDIERIVNGILHPPLPWQDMLQEFATRVVQTEESWSRRNRRFSDIVIPARHGLAMGELVVIGDTSGSIGGQVFSQTAVELTTIRDTVRPERTRVIWADDAPVSREEIFDEDEDIVLHPKGGGGTDMRKPLRYVEQFEPAVVVLITDGYTPWPDDEPPFPLIVVCSTNVPCPVGEVVRWSA